MNISNSTITAMLVFGGLFFILISFVKIKKNNIIAVAIEGKSKYLFFVGVVILFVGIYLTIFVPESTVKTPIPTSKPIGTQLPEIKINYTSDTAHIAENIIGTAKNIPDGYELWILVYPYAAKKYYPQHEEVSIQNGVWSIPVGIGTEDNVGEKFDIIAVLANRDARIEFTSYMVNGEKNNDWPGMNKIPDGAEVYDRITVVREYEKTTVTRETPEVPIQNRTPDLLQIITNISAMFASFTAIYGTYITYRTNKSNK
jgi:hypothetical protein